MAELNEFIKNRLINKIVEIMEMGKNIYNMEYKNPIIITFVNESYSNILLNWVAALKKIDITKYLVISLDENIYKICEKNNIKTCLIDFNIKLNGLNKLWVFRMGIFELILSYGYSFIHSDVDAIWLKNPINDFILNNKYCKENEIKNDVKNVYEEILKETKVISISDDYVATFIYNNDSLVKSNNEKDKNIDLEELIKDESPDMIFSQGTVFPQEILLKWNFILCCGFFYIKSNNKTRRIFLELIEYIKNINDDQKAVNMYFYEKLNIKWDKTKMRNEDKYMVELNMMRKPNVFECFRKELYGIGKINNERVIVKVLPHHLFQRIYMEEEPAYVRHILTQKNNEDKMKMFENTNCLFINYK